MGESRKEALLRRIEELRVSTGMSQTDLANAIGILPSAVSHWGRGKSGIALETVDLVAKVFSVDPAWLVYGTHAGGTLTTPDVPSMSPRMCSVPELIRVPRGRGKLQTKHLWALPLTLVKDHYRTKPEDAALVVVREEGIGGLIEHDYVLIDRSVTFPTRAALYVLNVKEGLIVRHLTVLEDTPLSVRVCGAEGTADKLIHDENDLNILGRVVGVIKRPS